MTKVIEIQPARPGQVNWLVQLIWSNFGGSVSGAEYLVEADRAAGYNQLVAQIRQANPEVPSNAGIRYAHRVRDIW